MRGPRRYEIGVGDDLREHARTKDEAFDLARREARRSRNEDDGHAYVFDVMARVGAPDLWLVDREGNARVLKTKGIR